VRRKVSNPKKAAINAYQQEVQERLRYRGSPDQLPRVVLAPDGNLQLAGADGSLSPLPAPSAAVPKADADQPPEDPLSWTASDLILAAPFLYMAILGGVIDVTGRLAAGLIPWRR
jgi:hypothetical protein